MTLFEQMSNDLGQSPLPPQYVPATTPRAIQPFPRPPRREPVVSWIPSLLVACLALGLLGQMVHEEASGIKEEQRRSSDYYSQLGIVEGLQEDVGKLVADPKTTTFTLTGSQSSVHRAVAMWNATRQAGLLFCDDLPILPNNQAYEIWATSKEGVAAKLGQFSAKPGCSVYSFNSPLTGVPVRIEVTAGPRSAANPPILASADATQSSSVGG
jgi:hypothetical protein